jgi:hypothetical protein
MRAKIVTSLRTLASLVACIESLLLPADSKRPQHNKK